MNELYHHGIKGQKWGIRRFQNRNGKLNSKGQQRYDDSKKKLSTGKKVAIGVGTAAVVAAGAYAVYRYRSMHMDTIIKSNSEIQHLARNAIEKFDNPFYATYKNSDKKAYLNPKRLGHDSGWKINQTIVAKRNLKVAGSKTSINTFKEWAKNNSSYEDRFGKFDLNNKKSIKRAYNTFIKEAPPAMGYKDKALASDFFKKMSEKGYDAVRDTYDQKLMKVKSPVIIFDGLQDLMTKRISEIKR